MKGPRFFRNEGLSKLKDMAVIDTYLMNSISE